jgi:pimeloyl-ACP methyl ester carboxylesterase
MIISSPPAIVHHVPGKLGLPPSGRDRAIARLEAELAAERKLPLQEGSQSLVYLHPEQPKRGTLIMFHGFTAGTWQFEPLAKLAYAAGYDVYIPRLPGHGLKDKQGTEDPSQLLTGLNWHQYESFGDHAYDLAKDLGGPVATLGLSVGGNVALAVAERHPEVSKVVAYAPFLWPKERRVQGLFLATHAADIATHGLAAPFLNGLTYSWGEACRLDTAAGKRPGHSMFYGGNAYGATELGWKVIADAPRLKAQLQLFATAVDDAADEDALKTLFRRAGAGGGWYYFPAAEGIPHPMVHPMEDNGKGQCPKLYDMTLQFLETGQPRVRGEQPR